MGFTTQDFDNDKENDSKPVEIPKDFYKADFKECNAYTKDDNRRLALIFEVEHDGETVEVGRFMSAKASTYSDEVKDNSDASDSHLGSLFDRTGLLEALELEISSRIQAKEWFDGEIPEGFLTEKEGGFSATDSNEHELLANAVEAQLSGHKFSLLVVTPDGDGGSLVEDVDPVDGYDYTSDEQDEGSSDSEESSGSDGQDEEDEDEDVLFDEDDDTPEPEEENESGKE